MRLREGGKKERGERRKERREGSRERGRERREGGREAQEGKEKDSVQTRDDNHVYDSQLLHLRSKGSEKISL